MKYFLNIFLLINIALFAQQEVDKGFFDFSSRKTKSILLSTVVPGAGQVYLGNTYKGAAITTTFWGLTLGAVLNENNFIAREDRLKLLINEYKAAGDYFTADRAWNEIMFEKSNRNNDDKRRKLYLYGAVAVYVINIVDILFFNEDKGEDFFSSLPFDIGLESSRNYNGIALNFKIR